MKTPSAPLVCFVFLSLPTLALAQPQYTVTDIGAMSPLAIGQGGMAAGIRRERAPGIPSTV